MPTITRKFAWKTGTDATIKLVAVWTGKAIRWGERVIRGKRVGEWLIYI